MNAALLMPGERADGEAFGLLLREVVSDMTVKSGQKCTAICRILVAAALYDTTAEGMVASLSTVNVGNPRGEGVRIGALVGRAQFATVREGLATLSIAATVLHDGRQAPLVDADPAIAACIGPVLFGPRDPDGTVARVRDGRRGSR